MPSCKTRIAAAGANVGCVVGLKSAFYGRLSFPTPFALQPSPCGKLASMECLEYFPRVECPDGQCEQCGGEYQVLPKCVDLRKAKFLVPTVRYAY